MGLILGLGGSPGGGHGNPLQHSYLENPMFRGTWRASDHGVAKSQVWLKKMSVHIGACPAIYTKKPFNVSVSV